jgi:exodeoxyribonuclease VII small subunit
MTDESNEIESCSFEQSLANLEAIVHDLEEGQIGLAEALARYEQGVGHLKRCYQLLDEADRKIELLTGLAPDGTAITEPFGDDQSTPAESAGRRRKAKATRPAPSPSILPDETT